MRPSLAALFCVTMLLIGSAETLAHPSQSKQSVSLPYLRAEVWIDYTPFDNKAVAIFTFSTTNWSKENVNCLNAYRDVKYVLRNRSGAIIKSDPNAWTKRPDTLTQQYTENPCEQLGWTTKQSRAFLETLFPRARHGKYMLYMTLAPRGRLNAAAFHPILVAL
jgi:hypothetical protein